MQIMGIIVGFSSSISVHQTAFQVQTIVDPFLLVLTPQPERLQMLTPPYLPIISSTLGPFLEL